MRARWTTPVTAWEIVDRRLLPTAVQAVWHFQRDRLSMLICARFLGHSPLMCSRVAEGDPGDKKPTVVIASAARRLSFRRTWLIRPMRRNTDEGVATADLRDGKKLVHRGRPVTLWRIVAEVTYSSGVIYFAWTHASLN